MNDRVPTWLALSSWLKNLPKKQIKEGVESDISRPLDTGQTGVSFLLRGPGNRSGRHVISTEPGRGRLSGVELQRSTIMKQRGLCL